MYNFNRNTLEIIFWDVKHGNAVYLKTPNGKNIIYDLGVGSYGSEYHFSPLKHLRNKYKINQLDMVIISHPDLDHIKDILNLNLFNVKCLARPRNLDESIINKKIRKSTYPDNLKYEMYLELDQKFIGKLNDYEDPCLPNNNGGVLIESFLSVPDTKTHIVNNHSLVSLISYAGIKVLLTGDNESPSWKYLLKQKGFLNSIENTKILLAPHHGRENGFYSDLFNYFHPYLTIISDGRFCDTSATNRYSAMCKGRTIHSGKRGDLERKCLTTRNDGVIHLKIGTSPRNKPYIDVRIK